MNVSRGEIATISRRTRQETAREGIQPCEEKEVGGKKGRT